MNKCWRKPVHGGKVFNLARKLGISVDEIIDFSANINPLGIPVKAREALLKGIDRLQHYPEMYAESLVEALAAKHGISLFNLLVGNGSTELIYLLVRVLRPTKALILTPAFTEYERAVGLYNGRLHFYHAQKKDNFVPRPDIMIAMLDEIKPDICFFGNPNNPTGIYLTPSDWLPFIKAAANRKIICIVDEAFIDFVKPHLSMIELIQRFNNLVVLRSLTKIFSLAGLRCGYLIASEEMVNELRNWQEPWNVNSLAISAALHAITDRQFYRRTREYIAGERNYLVEKLREFSFLQVFPSQVNYLLAHVQEDFASLEMEKFLREKYHLLIRLCGDFQGLNNSYIRLAIKNRDANDKLLMGLRDFSCIHSLG